MRRATILWLVVTAGCEDDSDVRCGEGTVERDGMCVVAGEDSSSDDDGASIGDVSAADDDDGSDDGEFDEGEVPGDCVGEAWSCDRFESEEGCLAQNGCYPAFACVGEEIDCTFLEYASPECEAAPHCYSDIMQVGTTSLPGCWPYDDSCEWGIDDCEAYGGTCHESIVCEGDPDGCELFDAGDCETHQGCYWQT